MTDAALARTGHEPNRASTVPTTGATGLGPVAPTAAAHAALHPLGLTGASLQPSGWLGAWQERTLAASIPHCIAHLDSDGALDNLRRLAGRSDAPYRGMIFADTDVYKTSEAVAWTLARTDVPELAGFLTETAALLAAVQGSDGYLNSWFQGVHPDQRWQDLTWGHELYCAGHLIQAAVAAARVGVAPELVAVARRVADLLVDEFGAGGMDGVCGHPEVETALVELYRVTGHRPYLDLAARQLELRGHGRLGGDRFGAQYFLDHRPVRETSEATGHAVRQLYLEAGVVDVAVETGDLGLLATSERRWDDLFATKTYITGAHGSRHRDEAIGDAYELPPDRAYAESCAAVASFHWNWRLLLATGRARYADEMERVLHNAIAGSTALDGRHFFYSNPLQLRTGHDGSDEDAPSQRLSWYKCSCCPPNLSRLMSSLQGYLATVTATGVQLHLYTDSELTAPLAGGPARITVRTGYPWDGRILVTVDGPAADGSAADGSGADGAAADGFEPGEWELALRVPGWCSRYAVSVAGRPVDAAPDGGYLRLRRRWAPGDTVVLDLAMPVEAVAAHPRVDAVRGCVAVRRGPVLYCLEQADLPDGVVVEDVSLPAPADLRAAAADDLLDVPVVVVGRGVLRTPSAARPLYQPATATDLPEQGGLIDLRLIPYARWGNRTPGGMRVWIPTTR